MSNLDIARNVVFKNVLSSFLDKESNAIVNTIALQPEKLPSQFTSVMEYFMAFEDYVILEMQASIQNQILQDTSPTNYQLHLSIESPDESKELPQSRFWLHDSQQNHSKLVFGDVVLLSQFPLCTLTETITDRMVALVGSAKKKSVDGQSDLRYCLFVDRKKVEQSWLGKYLNSTVEEITVYAGIVTNIFPQMRILASLLDRDRQIPFLEKAILNGVKATDNVQVPQGLTDKVGALFDFLNVYQMNCVMKVLRTKYGIVRIIGPPGTGKTTTTAAMLYSCRLQQPKVKILQTAPTNVAITNIAAQYLKVWTKIESPESKPRMIIYGRRVYEQIDSNVSKKLKPYFMEYKIEQLKTLSELTKSLQADFNHALSADKSLVELCHQLKNKAKLCYLLIEDIFPQCHEFNLISIPIPIINQKLRLVEGILNEMTMEFVDPQQFHSLIMKQDIVFEFQENLHRQLAEQIFLNLVNLVFCTVNSSASSSLAKSYSPTIVFLDEACQCIEAESTILLKPSVKRMVLVGDPSQLPATVQSRKAQQNGYGKSLFGRLEDLHKRNSDQISCSLILRRQYRMRAEISQWPSKFFYKGQLEDDESVFCNSHIAPWNNNQSHPIFSTPFVYLNVNIANEERNIYGSIRNLAEVTYVYRLLLTLFLKFHEEFLSSKATIGIISPYAYQVETLIYELSTLKRTISRKLDLAKNVIEELVDSIDIRSVDGFQGQERNIIIVSTVRSYSSSPGSTNNRLGFISDPRRLNVALTRGKQSVWVVGNSKVLATNSDMYKELIQHSKNKQCFFEAADADASREVILEEFSPSTSPEGDNDLSTSQEVNIKRKIVSQLKGSIWSNEICEKAWKVLCHNQPLVPAFLQKLLRILHGNFPKFSQIYRTSSVYSSSSVDLGSLFRVFFMKHSANDSSNTYCAIWTVGVWHKKKQCIRVWDIVPKGSLQQAFEFYCRLFNQYHESYLKCCLQEQVDVEKKIRVPIQFQANAPDFNFRVDDPRKNNGIKMEDDSEDSLLLIKSYFISPSIWEFFLINDEGKIPVCLEIPYKLSAEELDIVQCRHSCAVIGRSGTGKTSVIMHRMFRILKGTLRARRLDPTLPIARQLMVSVSATLINKVSEYFQRLMETIKLEGLNWNDDEVVLRNCKKVNECSTSTMPMFLTFDELLEVMDAKLTNPFLISSESESINERLKIVLSKSDFRQQKEAHSLGKVDVRTGNTTDIYRYFDKPSKRKRKDKVVTFRSFHFVYYPHFADRIRKSFDASTIYTEIMSYIKGSICSIVFCENGILTRDQYLAIAAEKRTGQHLNQMERSLIYEAFQTYEQTKSKLDEWDYGDICFHLYHEYIRKPTLILEKVDFLYLDEVQDLLPCQLLLFKFFLGKIDGCLFCGDTAQCIHEGSRFRFQRLNDILFDHFFPNIGTIEKASHMPRKFFLHRNYRSQASILRVGNIVVNLLVEFFPDEVDKLPQEESAICGPFKPSFLKETSIEYFSSHLFGMNNSNKQFGSDQVIIVRNDEVKQTLTEILPNTIVLTVLESKGLEWSDVFIYNFFSDSVLQDQWRVILKGEANQQNFDERRHRGLCSELKSLYVCITRAKSRLYFFDSNLERRKPFLTLLLQRSVGEIIGYCKEAMPLVSESTLVEWVTRGYQYKRMGVYSEAIKCFKNGRDVNQTHLTEALLHEEKARFFEAKNELQMAQKEFLMASHSLKVAGKIEECATMLVYAREFVKAAEMYEMVGKHREMLVAYLEGGCYDKAFTTYKKYRYVFKKEFGQQANQVIFQMAEFFYGKSVVDKKWLDVLKLSGESEFVKAFLRSHNESQLLAEYELEQGNFLSAGQLYESQTLEYEKAGSCYMKIFPQTVSSTKAANRCFLKHVTLRYPYYIPMSQMNNFVQNRKYQRLLQICLDNLSMCNFSQDYQFSVRVACSLLKCRKDISAVDLEKLPAVQTHLKYCALAAYINYHKIFDSASTVYLMLRCVSDWVETHLTIIKKLREVCLDLRYRRLSQTKLSKDELLKSVFQLFSLSVDDSVEASTHGNKSGVLIQGVWKKIFKYESELGEAEINLEYIIPSCNVKELFNKLIFYLNMDSSVLIQLEQSIPDLVCNAIAVLDAKMLQILAAIRQDQKQILQETVGTLVNNIIEFSKGFLRLNTLLGSGLLNFNALQIVRQKCIRRFFYYALANIESSVSFELHSMGFCEDEKNIRKDFTTALQGIQRTFLNSSIYESQRTDYCTLLDNCLLKVLVGRKLASIPHKFTHYNLRYQKQVRMIENSHKIVTRLLKARFAIDPNTDQCAPISRKHGFHTVNKMASSSSIESTLTYSANASDISCNTIDEVGTNNNTALKSVANVINHIEEINKCHGGNTQEDQRGRSLRLQDCQDKLMSLFHYPSVADDKVGQDCYRRLCKLQSSIDSLKEFFTLTSIENTMNDCRVSIMKPSQYINLARAHVGLCKQLHDNYFIVDEVQKLNPNIFVELFEVTAILLLAAEVKFNNLLLPKSVIIQFLVPMKNLWPCAERCKYSCLSLIHAFLLLVEGLLRNSTQFKDWLRSFSFSQLQQCVIYERFLRILLLFAINISSEQRRVCDFYLENVVHQKRNSTLVLNGEIFWKFFKHIQPLNLLSHVKGYFEKQHGQILYAVCQSKCEQKGSLFSRLCINIENGEIDLTPVNGISKDFTLDNIGSGSDWEQVEVIKNTQYRSNDVVKLLEDFDDCIPQNIDHEEENLHSSIHCSSDFEDLFACLQNRLSAIFVNKLKHKFIDWAERARKNVKQLDIGVEKELESLKRLTNCYEKRDFRNDIQNLKEMNISFESIEVEESFFDMVEFNWIGKKSFSRLLDKIILKRVNSNFSNDEDYGKDLVDGLGELVDIFETLHEYRDTDSLVTTLVELFDHVGSIAKKYKENDNEIESTSGSQPTVRKAAKSNKSKKSSNKKKKKNKRKN